MGRKEAEIGWKVGRSERLMHRGDSLDRWGDGLQKVYLFSFFLFRMSGEYPNSVSICKYLQDPFLPLVTYYKSKVL